MSEREMSEEEWKTRKALEKSKKMVENLSEPINIIIAEDEPKSECEFGCPHCEKIIKLRIQPMDKENIKL